MTIDQIFRANLIANEVIAPYSIMSRKDSFVLGYQAAVEDSVCLTESIKDELREKYKSTAPGISTVYNKDPLVLALKKWYGEK